MTALDEFNTTMNRTALRPRMP